MRVRIIHIIIIAVAYLSLASCQKETSVEHTNGLAGTFTASINGVDWIAADSTKGASILQGMINISGISVDNKQLSITLNDTVPGVYPLSQVSASLAAYTDNDSANLYAYTTDEGSDSTQAGGLVTITEIDRANKTLTGTFSFKAYRDIDNHQKTITAGVFYKLSYVSSLPAANNADTMRASIDGVSWNGQSIVATALAPQLAISGSALNGSQSIGLIMPLDITPGSYTFDGFGGTNIGLYIPSPTATTEFISSNGGSLIILENNTSTQRVRGSFQFQAYNPLSPASSDNISSGYFSVQYQ